MKRYLFLFLLYIGCVCAQAQDIVPDTILNIPPDTLQTAQANTIIADSLTAVELPLFFDEALAWIDTTECESDTIITDLPDSVFKARLQALPYVVEVPYNAVVRNYILRYIKRSPRQLASLQRRAEYYFPIFEDILARYGLPYELCYLAVIESALNPQAG